MTTSFMYFQCEQKSRAREFYRRRQEAKLAKQALTLYNKNDQRNCYIDLKVNCPADLEVYSEFNMYKTGHGSVIVAVRVDLVQGDPILFNTEFPDTPKDMLKHRPSFAQLEPDVYSTRTEPVRG